MKNDIPSQIIRDSHVGAHIRGTHIGIFDISGELPVLTAVGYSVVADNKKSTVWLKRKPTPRGIPHSYMMIDHKVIKESMVIDEFGVIDNMPTEAWVGHGFFIGWWKHRQISATARNFDVRVPTFKDSVEIENFHNVLYMINLPVYRIITAAIATNVLIYNNKGYDRADCLNAFFARFPSLEKYRGRVEKVIFGKWLEEVVETVKQGTLTFNVNQLTGL